MEQPNNNLRVFLDATKSNYDTIANADNALDGKAGTLMGIEIAFGIGYFTFFNASLTCTDILGLILLLISTLLLLIVNWPRVYLPFSVNMFEKLDYLGKTESNMLLQLISDGQNALDKNSRKLACKTSLYEAALGLLIFSSFLFIFKI